MDMDIENKRLLWDTLVEQKKFKEDVTVDKTQQLFETILKEIDGMNVSIDEKNKLFLDQWMRRLEELSMETRSQWFEERVQQKQYKQPPTVNELAEIKKLLYRILELLE